VQPQVLLRQNLIAALLLAAIWYMIPVDGPIQVPQLTTVGLGIWLVWAIVLFILNLNELGLGDKPRKDSDSIEFVAVAVGACALSSIAAFIICFIAIYITHALK
jgi:hypothetical protein